MAIQAQTPTWSDIQERLMERAANDDIFRQQLLADPKPLIEAEMAAAETGFKIPDAIKVNVVEETATSYYLVLPARETNGADGDLSDEELAGVSGGSSAIMQGFFQFFVNKEWQKSTPSTPTRSTPNRGGGWIDTTGVPTPPRELT